MESLFAGGIGRAFEETDGLFRGTADGAGGIADLIFDVIGGLPDDVRGAFGGKNQTGGGAGAAAGGGAMFFRASRL